MIRMSRSLAVLIPLALSLMLTIPVSGTSAMSKRPVPPPRFDSGRVLRGQGGGEPSIAVDTTRTRSRNHVYVEAIGGWGSTPPKGRPAGSGPVIWHSYNDGSTFSSPVPFDVNGPSRGGDGDVAVTSNGNVVVTDLNVSHAWVQVSSNGARTFNTGTPTGFEDDRPWLTTSGNNVYVAYHDFVLEVPVVCTSTDGGDTFTNCDPATITNQTIAQQCAENTIPARALSIDQSKGAYHGALNFMFSCSTANENVNHPPYGPLHDYYLAQSTNGGLSYQDYTVFKASTAGGRAPDYANIFGTLAIDSKGNYYALLDGTANDNNPAANPYHIYLLTSTNHGHTWSKPKRVDFDPNRKGTHVLADMAVTSPGNVDIVWYGTSATGEPNGVCGTVATQSPCKDGFPLYSSKAAPAWRIYMAQSTDALSAMPRFKQVTVTQTPVHYGEICTNGIVCGSSDRTLLDFMSVGVDCRGFAHMAFAANTKAEEKADFNNGAADIHEVNQIGSTRIAPPSGCNR